MYYFSRASHCIHDDGQVGKYSLSFLVMRIIFRELLIVFMLLVGLVNNSSSFLIIRITFRELLTVFMILVGLISTYRLSLLYILPS